jgi:TPR repeat protein
MEKVNSPSELYDLALRMADSREQNLKEVFKYLSDACASGEPRAKYAVANWYLNGVGHVDKDIPKAFDILSEIEDSFVAEALFDLAIFYDLGRHVDEDAGRAFSLYMRAALLGHQESCRQMAEYYREGLIVAHDEALHASWLKRSQHEESDISPPYRIWLRPLSDAGKL